MKHYRTVALFALLLPTALVAEDRDTFIKCSATVMALDAGINYFGDDYVAAPDRLMPLDWLQNGFLNEFRDENGDISSATRQEVDSKREEIQSTWSNPRASMEAAYKDLQECQRLLF